VAIVVVVAVEAGIVIEADIESGVVGVMAVEVNTGDWVGIAEEVGSMLEEDNMFEVALAEAADSKLVARLGEDSKVVAAEDSNSLVVIRRREPLREKVVTKFVASVQVAGTLGFPKEKGLRVEEQDTLAALHTFVADSRLVSGRERTQDYRYYIDLELKKARVSIFIKDITTGVP